MRKLFSVICLFAFFNPTFAQENSGRQLCGLTGENMKGIRQQVKENILMLKKQGKLQFRQQDIDIARQTALLEPQAPISIRFIWPLRPKNAEDYRYYHIGNYTDLDSTGNACVRDYNGGRRTYDGHQGIDIGVGPYSWARKKAGDVHVVAAAAGIIVERHDGEFDGNCDWDNITGTTNRGNHVVILHADDSTVTFYMHLKTNSVTSKQVGDQVQAGEYLGAVASSGRSTGPHLHFQVNTSWSDPDDDKGTFVEPFSGSFNYTSSVSLWSNQKPYNEPGIYAMETHLGSMDYYTANCDSSVNLNSLHNSFQPNQVVNMRTHLLDWVDGSQVSFGLLRPDGSAVGTVAGLTNTCSYLTPVCGNNSVGVACRLFLLTGSYTLPSDAQQGTWTYWVNFNNNITHHYFTVDCLATQSFSGTQGGHRGYIVSNTITSTASISSNSNNDITYKADNYVLLSPGFVATQGCTFTANTRGCVNGN
jgi:murein DD-endopeptidase MepM/ murein hydrolase activator NlpD